MLINVLNSNVLVLFQKKYISSLYQFASEIIGVCSTKITRVFLFMYV